MNRDEAARQRALWLGAWFDLDADAQSMALQDATIPAEWRAAAARHLHGHTVAGILDRDPQPMVEQLVGAPANQPAAGHMVGRYRLEAMIGQGGMATVWSARHQDPQLPQQVAVKLLRTGLATPEWCDRFLREQRILASLSHPHVTRLFDAGVSDSGAPYIVMELVHGRTILEHCDAHGLGIRQRVQLFVKVCAAVAYAHRNLIVHRDLKPANVLVDAEGEPHLLDFGIAKLLDVTGADAEHTRTGMAMLTPAYAAPEQLAQGSITTATDVYGLGALLHELLTGTRTAHHDDGRLQRPSACVASDAAAARAEDSTRRLRAWLRGDLDAILERALRREAELRYASASELGADLERWLQRAPVQARAGNWRYRADKFVRRHWLALGLALTTVAGLSIATAFSWRASLRADRSAAAALAQAERARNSRDFVLELMRDLRPGSTTRTPTQLLDRAADRIDTRFANDEATRIELLLVLGELERGYGRMERARALFEQASSSARARYGVDSPLWLQAEANLAHTRFRLGEYRDGRDRLQQALRDYDQASGRSGPARILALVRLGQLQEHLGETAVALDLHRQADALAAASLHPTDPLHLTVKELYGGALANNGQLDTARQVLRENLALVRARFGGSDLSVVSAMETLALREIESGEPQRAVTLLLDAQRIAADLLDGPHVFAAYVENTLGLAQLRLGQSAAARASFRRALAIYEQLYAAPHLMLAATHENLGEAAFELADYAAAAASFDRAASMRLALAADAPPQALDTRCLAAESLILDGRLDQAQARLASCAEALYPDAGPDSEFAAILSGIEATLALASGQLQQARIAASFARSADASLAPHDRLRRLLVLAELDVQAGDTAALAAYLDEAAAITRMPIWPRPCHTAHQLAQMSAFAASAGLAPRTWLEADRASSCASTAAGL